MDVSVQIHNFATVFKCIAHETFSNITNSGGAIFLSPTHSRADSYALSYSLVNPSQKGQPVSRLPKRPLVVDLDSHTLTIPIQVVGYTLTLESEEGKVFTYHIIGTTLEIPQEMTGTYNVTIFDSSCMYKGTLFL